MRWRKHGLLFRPDGNLPWLRSHAALPLPVRLDGAVYRVFFSGRDARNRSHVGYADISLKPRPRVLQVGVSPVLVPGMPGGFDDSGIGIGSIVPLEDGHRFYYMGWNLGVTVPWRNSIGLAVGDARLPVFERWSPGPLLDRSPADPYTLSYPWVLRDGPVWHMWYGSNLKWGGSTADMTHVIKYARSDDGISWQRSTDVAIDVDDAGTYALARPTVVKDADMFRMWYAYRGPAYRIGYAESQDGISWVRRDANAGLDPSQTGWDSDMVCYPCVFDHEDTRYMLYNGNGYGETGFGLAEMERPL